MKVIAIILFFSFSNFVFASDSGWNVSVHDEEWATLYETPQGELSLSEAVDAVPKGIWLRNFRIFLSEDHPLLQRELHEFLSSNYPDLHNEALSSSGNMHNPKVIEIREPVREAILASTFAKKIGNALASRCERIASASYEKLIIQKNNDTPIYSAMVWLSTEKCT